MTQVPAIFKNNKKTKVYDPKPMFDHADLQRLHVIVRVQLEGLNFSKKVLKGLITVSYDKSIPGTTDGLKQFLILNDLRNDLRVLKSQEVNLIQLQRKLKKMKG